VNACVLRSVSVSGCKDVSVGGCAGLWVWVVAVFTCACVGGYVLCDSKRFFYTAVEVDVGMGWLRLVASLKL